MPWRELSDQEYQALSLAQKIDYRMIAAGQCRNRAGPQWRDGQPQLPEDMPPKWHYNIGLAKAHEAEAARLGQILKESVDRRESAGLYEPA